MLVLTSASQNNFRVGFFLAFGLSGDELDLAESTYPRETAPNCEAELPKGRSRTA
jgi:hypothetical protein